MLPRELIHDSNANNATRTIAVEEIGANGKAPTLVDVFGMDAVQDFLGQDVDNICEAVEEINGTAVPDAFRSTLLNAAITENMVVAVDIDVTPEEDEGAQNEAESEVGAPGVATVYTSGGLQATNIEITCGVTSLRDAIYNDCVRSRSGMSDAQLSNCDIMVNDSVVSADSLDLVKCNNGDRIVLSIRTCHSKGC